MSIKLIRKCQTAAGGPIDIIPSDNTRVAGTQYIIPVKTSTGKIIPVLQTTGNSKGAQAANSVNRGVAKASKSRVVNQMNTDKDVKEASKVHKQLTEKPQKDISTLEEMHDAAKEILPGYAFGTALNEAIHGEHDQAASDAMLGVRNTGLLFGPAGIAAASAAQASMGLEDLINGNYTEGIAGIGLSALPYTKIGSFFRETPTLNYNPAYTYRSINQAGFEDIINSGGVVANPGTSKYGYLLGDMKISSLESPNLNIYHKGKLLPKKTYITNVSPNYNSYGRTFTTENTLTSSKVPSPKMEEPVARPGLVPEPGPKPRPRTTGEFIDFARQGDPDAQAELARYGVSWGEPGVYRYVNRAEVDDILAGKTYMGRYNGRVDVTGSRTPSTGKATEYRVVFKPIHDLYKRGEAGNRAIMKNPELKDGWITGGYSMEDVDYIEQLMPDGTYQRI